MINPNQQVNIFLNFGGSPKYEITNLIAPIESDNFRSDSTSINPNHYKGDNLSQSGSYPEPYINSCVTVNGRDVAEMSNPSNNAGSNHNFSGSGDYDAKYVLSKDGSKSSILGYAIVFNDPDSLESPCQNSTNQTNQQPKSNPNPNTPLMNNHSNQHNSNGAEHLSTKPLTITGQIVEEFIRQWFPNAEIIHLDCGEPESSKEPGQENNIRHSSSNSEDTAQSKQEPSLDINNLPEFISDLINSDEEQSDAEAQTKEIQGISALEDRITANVISTVKDYIDWRLDHLFLKEDRNLVDSISNYPFADEDLYDFGYGEDDDDDLDDDDLDDEYDLSSNNEEESLWNPTDPNFVDNIVNAVNAWVKAEQKKEDEQELEARITMNALHMVKDYIDWRFDGFPRIDEDEDEDQAKAQAAQNQSQRQTPSDAYNADNVNAEVNYNRADCFAFNTHSFEEYQERKPKRNRRGKIIENYNDAIRCAQAPLNNQANSSETESPRVDYYSSDFESSMSDHKTPTCQTIHCGRPGSSTYSRMRQDASNHSVANGQVSNSTYKDASKEETLTESEQRILRKLYDKFNTNMVDYMGYLERRVDYKLEEELRPVKEDVKSQCEASVNSKANVISPRILKEMKDVVAEEVLESMDKEYESMYEDLLEFADGLIDNGLSRIEREVMDPDNQVFQEIEDNVTEHVLRRVEELNEEFFDQTSNVVEDCMDHVLHVADLVMKISQMWLDNLKSNYTITIDSNLIQQIEDCISEKVRDAVKKETETLIDDVTDYADLILDCGLRGVERDVLERLTDRLDERAQKSVDNFLVDSIEKGMGDKATAALEKRVTDNVCDQVYDYFDSDMERYVRSMVNEITKETINEAIREYVNEKLLDMSYLKAELGDGYTIDEPFDDTVSEDEYYSDHMALENLFPSDIIDSDFAEPLDNDYEDIFYDDVAEFSDDYEDYANEDIEDEFDYDVEDDFEYDVEEISEQEQDIEETMDDDVDNTDIDYEDEDFESTESDQTNDFPSVATELDEDSIEDEDPFDDNDDLFDDEDLIQRIHNFYNGKNQLCGQDNETTKKLDANLNHGAFSKEKRYRDPITGRYFTSDTKIINPFKKEYILDEIDDSDNFQESLLEGNTKAINESKQESTNDSEALLITESNEEAANAGSTDLLTESNEDFSQNDNLSEEITENEENKEVEPQDSEYKEIELTQPKPDMTEVIIRVSEGLSNEVEDANASYISEPSQVSREHSGEKGVISDSGQYPEINVPDNELETCVDLAEGYALIVKQKGKPGRKPRSKNKPKTPPREKGPADRTSDASSGQGEPTQVKQKKKPGSKPGSKRKSKTPPTQE